MKIKLNKLIIKLEDGEVDHSSMEITSRIA